MTTGRRPHAGTVVSAAVLATVAATAGCAGIPAASAPPTPSSAVTPPACPDRLPAEFPDAPAGARAALVPGSPVAVTVCGYSGPAASAPLRATKVVTGRQVARLAGELDDLGSPPGTSTDPQTGAGGAQTASPDPTPVIARRNVVADTLDATQCPLEAEPAQVVLFGYAGGTTLAVRLADVNCRSLTNGSRVVVLDAPAAETLSGVVGPTTPTRAPVQGQQVS